jgi:hypothetical protein
MSMSETENQQVVDWQRNRQARVDGYAAVLTYLNAAIAAVPEADPLAYRVTEELALHALRTRGRLRAVIEETNPYI